MNPNKTPPIELLGRGSMFFILFLILMWVTGDSWALIFFGPFYLFVFGMGLVFFVLGLIKSIRQKNLSYPLVGAGVSFIISDLVIFDLITGFLKNVSNKEANTLFFITLPLGIILLVVGWVKNSRKQLSNPPANNI